MYIICVQYNYYYTEFARLSSFLDDQCQDQLHMSRYQSSLESSSYFFVNGLWHSSCEPAQRLYVIHDRPAAKQLQFPWTQAFPAALHWQLMTFINSGGAGQWRSTCYHRRWYAVKQLSTKISDDNCWGNLLVCCLLEYRLMVCSEHVKEQIFVRRRKRLHKWWFAFLLCVDRVSDGIRIGALWLAVQCGKEHLTPSQQVFEHSRLLSNYRVQFWKVSFSKFAECGELSLVEGIRHGITTCDGVHSKKLETCVPESSHDVIDVQHSSIPLLNLHQSLDTQFPYPENENGKDVCVVTEDAYDLLSISYSIDYEANHQHVCLFMVEQTFICTDHQNIGGQSRPYMCKGGAKEVFCSPCFSL